MSLSKSESVSPAYVQAVSLSVLFLVLSRLAGLCLRLFGKVLRACFDVRELK